MIGNNHHMTPFAGEDFQMFERDLPGENKSVLSYQDASAEVPVETCETINGSWGYNITDKRFKTVDEIVRLLAGAAGRSTNLLLNVGPMPNGLIQPEFCDSLAGAGKWLQQYGESIYGTRRGPVDPQPWGVTTQKDKKIFIHFFRSPSGNSVYLPGVSEKIKTAVQLGTEKTVKFRQYNEGVIVSLDGVEINGPDTVVELRLK